MTFLEDIIAEKRIEVENNQLPENMNSPRNIRSFMEAISEPSTSIIAEVKRKSPSMGNIKDVDAVKIAREYESAGASAVSVLTDLKYFGGSVKDLRDVKENVDIPVLRKDFIVNEKQISESASYGADAVLLIAAVLREHTAAYVDMAQQHGLECLVEIHDEDDLSLALDTHAEVIGINNRDLRTLEVDLNVTEKLAPMISKKKYIVAESGIKTREDVLRMEAAGANAILVGSSIMSSEDICGKIRELMGYA